jgi:hypothetical protein
MGKELALPGKWTFRAHGAQVVLVKKAFEKRNPGCPSVGAR